MKPLLRTLSVMVFGAAIVSTAGAVDSAAAAAFSPSDLMLGNSSDTPLVYFKPASGLELVLSQTSHDGFGQVTGYSLELGSGAAAKLTVLVRRTSDDKTRPARFIARAGEHTLGELSTARTKAKLVALNPTDAGGVVLAAPGELTLDVTTELAYDDFGRQQVAAQTFVHAGAKWKVTFSAYTRDRFGRITGCRGKLNLIP